jgi:hypothetical protein
MSATAVDRTTARRLTQRRVVLADGVACLASGVILTLAAGRLAGALGLPELLLRLAGVSLLPVGAGVLLLATRVTMPREAVWTVVGLNLFWSIASLVLLVSGWVEPTTTGVVVVIGQAMAVAVIAALEIIGLRREP